MLDKGRDSRNGEKGTERGNTELGAQGKCSQETQEIKALRKKQL